MGWVSIDWGKLLKVLIAVLTAIAGSIGGDELHVVVCYERVVRHFVESGEWREV